MGVRWGGRGDMRRSDLWTAGLAGALVGGVAGGLMMWAQDDDPAPARDAPLAEHVGRHRPPPPRG